MVVEPRVLNGVGGHSHWKVVRGCAALKTPFSGHFLALNTETLFLFFWKKKLCISRLFFADFG